MALRGAALVGGFLLVAAPIGLLNLRTTGRASILPYSGGANLYIGNNPDRRETITIRPGLQREKLIELPAGIGLQGGYRQERYYVGRVVDYAKSDPVGLLEGLGAKTLQFASSRELPCNVDIYLFRRWSLVLSAGIWKAGLLGFPFGAPAALAALGALHGRRRVPAPVWLFLLLYPAAVVAVFVTARYRVPAVPILCVLAAAGLAGAWRIAAARRLVELAVAACLVGGVALASSFADPSARRRSTSSPSCTTAWAAPSRDAAAIARRRMPAGEPWRSSPAIRGRGNSYGRSWRGSDRAAEASAGPVRGPSATRERSEHVAQPRAGARGAITGLPRPPWLFHPRAEAPPAEQARRRGFPGTPGRAGAKPR